jgi:hypothetical protein
MVQPAAKESNLRNSDEGYDIIPNLEDMFDIPHITVINANTKRNPSAKNDPDLVDYVIVTGNLSIPKNKNRIEVGYETVKLRRVESSARKQFEKGNATETLALYRQGYLGTVSEERLRLLEKDAAVEEKFAREEREDSEFVMVGPEDYIF